ncbi:MAG: mannonate dehydratase [Chitinophagaceae bacterium]
MKKNRRDFIKNTSAMAALSFGGIGAASAKWMNEDDAVLKPRDKIVQWPLAEGPNTLKIVLGCPLNADVKQMRRLKQIGVNHVSTGGWTNQEALSNPKPWKINELQGYMNMFKENGLTLINLMHPVGTNIVLGREGRDAEIEIFKESLRVASVCGLPNVEYNFYVDRLVEGYYETEGRGGSGLTSFDFSKVKGLAPKPEVGIHKAEEIWANLTYFLKAVIPVAEKAGVRLALHPNDPVSQTSHGSDQIMANLAGWKRLITIVDSPCNGITFDCGVTREMGEDPVEVCKYFASRDRINHVHYRNVISEIPYDKYTEVFIDEGQVNMFAVMQELMKQGYKRGLYPEHPHILDYDREHAGGDKRSGGTAGGGGGGGYAGEVFNVGFARAMMYAVMSVKKK